MATAVRHQPVLPDRVIALLAPALTAPDAVLVDATLGLGGHAEHALTQFPNLHLVGLDRDNQAIELSRERLSNFGERITLVHAVYDELPEVLRSLGLPKVQGILFDLGVSSMQLDEAERGFSYANNAPLDMRMDASTGVTAADVLNTYEEKQLVRVLRMYGEEKFAGRIASRIVKERAVTPFTNSTRLVDLIRDAIPAPARRTGGNPAKRTFQALRIEVNGELDALGAALPAALDALCLGGRIVVMSYQSLEDKMVKRAFAKGAHPDIPRGLPVIPEELLPWLRLLTRGAEVADEAALADNPRAASVRVRAAERVAA
ncbi:MAG: 16S rRNA (cytosine(1402)-N(4))-methyltransferase RsmH [Candidatus Nanopelagicales bacterium]|nr:16S rRNA (cytosine(1402)-N(4))-methyltransferase RsmH [Candidatus Nanopelagicales bacterium]